MEVKFSFDSRHYSKSRDSHIFVVELSPDSIANPKFLVSSCSLRAKNIARFSFLPYLHRKISDRSDLKCSSAQFEHVESKCKRKIVEFGHLGEEKADPSWWFFGDFFEPPPKSLPTTAKEPDLHGHLKQTVRIKEEHYSSTRSLKMKVNGGGKEFGDFTRECM